MSKKFNYTKQFNKNEEVAPDTVVNNSNNEPEVKPEPEVKHGVVSGCEKLNVRKGPSKEMTPVHVISKGTKVTIIEELPNWFKITTANGKINGYCMAEFISVN